MTPAAPTIRPNFYQFHGHQLAVTYATSGIDGQPHVTYHDAHTTLAFKGDQIRTVETEIGLLVTVTLVTTVDSGSTAFTVLVPHVNLDASKRAPITAVGITTIHRFSLVPFMNRGQTDLYTVTLLQGIAEEVTF